MTIANLSTDVDFTLVKDWGLGFEGKISITNNSDSNIDSWRLEFDFPNQISKIWDAEIESREDGSYVVSNALWNREIPAGKTVTFGFIGDKSVTSEPENFELTGSIFKSPSTSDNIYTSSNPDLEPELKLNPKYQGRATFYDATATKGNAGYDIPESNELEKITSINSVQWNGSEASGAFLEVSGPKQRDGADPIIVQVIDQLPERADGLDLSEQAFAKVADPVDGVVNVDYQLVGPPDDYLTAYGYKIGEGIVVEGIPETNPYYAAVRLNNHRYPIESVDLITDDDKTIGLDRESDNRFVLNGNYPLYGAQDLRVTDIFGQQVTLDDVNITNGSSADIVTGEQFEIL
jgi:expansin (peptidoglycan-binding protein)